jgi:hypothetical protein
MPEKWRLLLAGRDDNIGAGLKIKADQFGLTKNISFLDADRYSRAARRKRCRHVNKLQL